jgi:hypothetical protein
LNKKTLSEADICAKFITPALTGAGWSEVEQVFREYTLWTCPCSTDGYGLRSSVLSITTAAGLSTGGVAPATLAPTVGNPCSMG